MTIERNETLQDWLDCQKTRKPPTKLEVLGAFMTLARELGLKSTAPLEPWTINSRPRTD